MGDAFRLQKAKSNARLTAMMAIAEARFCNWANATTIGVRLIQSTAT